MRGSSGAMEKPDVDEISGIAPAVAIRQKIQRGTPRSTVATATEIYDYLRLLFARMRADVLRKVRTEVRRTAQTKLRHGFVAGTGSAVLRVASVRIPATAGSGCFNAARKKVQRLPRRMQFAKAARFAEARFQPLVPGGAIFTNFFAGDAAGCDSRSRSMCSWTGWR